VPAIDGKHSTCDKAPRIACEKEKWAIEIFWLTKALLRDTRL
jgi:hypothetical protein